MMISIRKLLTPLFMLFVVVSITACGSGGDDSAGSSNVDISGSWSGTWASSVYTLDDTFDTTITQQGSILSGSINVPYISLAGADLKGTIDGRTITFGDIAGLITFTGTVSQDATTLSGTYVIPSESDNGTWQGTKN
ncbi:MAG: hypothetical protein VST72_03900 [Nitrospirota bacterium]|nr:hypothetical protein [Nitrospirota bacterium]